MIDASVKTDEVNIVAYGIKSSHDCILKKSSEVFQNMKDLNSAWISDSAYEVHGMTYRASDLLEINLRRLMNCYSYLTNTVEIGYIDTETINEILASKFL